MALQQVSGTPSASCDATGQLANPITRSGGLASGPAWTPRADANVAFAEGAADDPGGTPARPVGKMNLGIDVADLLDRLVRFHEEHLEAGGPNPVREPPSRHQKPDPQTPGPPVATSTPSLKLLTRRYEGVGAVGVLHMPLSIDRDGSRPALRSDQPGQHLLRER